MKRQSAGGDSRFRKDFFRKAQRIAQIFALLETEDPKSYYAAQVSFGTVWTAKPARVTARALLSSKNHGLQLAMALTFQNQGCRMYTLCAAVR